MTTDELISLLRPLAPFYYWPNVGNLGDLLIAEATRQFFQRNALAYREYDPENPPQEEHYHLVYGGGGRFTSHWGMLPWFSEKLTAPQVSQAVILPHSLYQADDFIRSFDARHTIICREKRSYEYCQSLNHDIRVELADDMGLQLRLNELGDLPAELTPTNAEEKRMLQCIRKGICCHMAKGVRRSTVTSPHGGKEQKIAFILRTDAERSGNVTSLLSYDISLACGNFSCKEAPYNGALLRGFAQALEYPDIVVTNRLHVGIMAHHVGKEVYLLDNDYGKLSGVYEQALSQIPDIHLIAGGELPAELQAALRKLNAPLPLALKKTQLRVQHFYSCLRALPGKIARHILRH